MRTCVCGERGVGGGRGGGGTNHSIHACAARGTQVCARTGSGVAQRWEWECKWQHPHPHTQSPPPPPHKHPHPHPTPSHHGAHLASHGATQVVPGRDGVNDVDVPGATFVKRATRQLLHGGALHHARRSCRMRVYGGCPCTPKRTPQHQRADTCAPRPLHSPNVKRKRQVALWDTLRCVGTKLLQA